MEGPHATYNKFKQSQLKEIIYNYYFLVSPGFSDLVQALVRKIMSTAVESIVSSETWSLYHEPNSAQETQTKLKAPSCKEEMY